MEIPNPARIYMGIRQLVILETEDAPSLPENMCKENIFNKIQLFYLQILLKDQQEMDLTHLTFHMIRFSHRGSPLDKTAIQRSRQSVELDAEIMWSGVAWICDKQLKHYPAFCRNKTNIYIHSIVWVLGNGERKTCLGYVEDMYENEEREKMVQVRKFLFHEDIKGQTPKLYPLSREVLITPIVEQISAEDVDGLASVVAPCHFHNYEESLPLILSFQTFMCCKELKDNSINAFIVTELLGYHLQPLLTYLGYYVPGLSNNAQDPDSQRHKRSKVHSRAGLKGLARNGTKAEMSEEGPKLQRQMSFKANNDIELLCHESGMQGCWLRCKILRISRNRMKVEYYDLPDGNGQLEEWVPAAREAAPDKLGMRCGSRLTVRPCPNWDSSDVAFEVGAAVDVWWLDGWWEGIFIGHDTSCTSRAQVYFTGEEMMMTVERRNIRASKDWIDNRWVDIMPNPHFHHQQ